MLFVLYEVLSIVTFYIVDAQNDWESTKVKQYRANYIKGCNKKEMEPTKSLQNASLSACGYFAIFVA